MSNDTPMKLDAAIANVRASMSDRQKVELLREVLESQTGYLLNAMIGLESGSTKLVTIDILNGALGLARGALHRTAD